MRSIRRSALIAVCVLAAACAGSSEDAPPTDGTTEIVEEVADDVIVEDEPEVERIVESEATEVLRSMSDTLTAAERLSFEAQLTNESFLSNGQGVDFSTDARVTLRRPNGILVDRRSDKYHRRLVFDGTTVVLTDVDKNLYAKKELGGSIEELLDALFERFGLDVPLADLIVGDSYTSLSDVADTILYIGKNRVRGIPCHHLAFTNDVLEWQVWVQSEGPPLPRKMVLVDKGGAGTPRFSAFITNWNLSPDAPDSMFTFRPPAGAEEIDMTASEPIEDDDAVEGGE